MIKKNLQQQVNIFCFIFLLNFFYPVSIYCVSKKQEIPSLKELAAKVYLKNTKTKNVLRDLESISLSIEQELAHKIRKQKRMIPAISLIDSIKYTSWIRCIAHQKKDLFVVIFNSKKVEASDLSVPTTILSKKPKKIHSQSITGLTSSNKYLFTAFEDNTLKIFSFKLPNQFDKIKTIKQRSNKITCMAYKSPFLYLGSDYRVNTSKRFIVFT